MIAHSRRQIRAFGFSGGGEVTVFTVTKRKTPQQERVRRHLAVVDANEKHARSTTQRDDAATELGMTLPDFVAALDEARRMGCDIDRYPPKQ